VRESLEQLRNELHLELAHILQYWMRYSIDEEHGGFFGKIDNDNKADGNAKKGLVLNARILWTFSAAYIYTKEEKYLAIAHRAYQYLINNFLDKQYGGFYWAVNKDGKTVEDKKQVYGIAFCLYGFAEYYKATQNEDALQHAKDCYAWIEQYSFDTNSGGYLEAFTRNWQPVEDLRLSTKDANEKKTMNTHLHVLEAYANLFKVWKDEDLERSIRLLLENFIDHINNRDNGHLNLYFDENWQVKAGIISYGHDIEAAWLLQEATETIGDKLLCGKIKQLSIKLANAATEGIDKDGGLWYETDRGDLVKQKHWWPQAEAMMGFFNTWQLTGDEIYLQYVLRNWKFIQQYIRDSEKGEWFWGINADGAIMPGQDKAGFWKCPYHNGRACIEISKRIEEINS
jgi:mannobiose 2-epimerase